MNPHEAQVARRRWRNLMIAAQASGTVSREEREHLEKMRRRLGIPVSAATAIAEAYEREGGAIQLFGGTEQRLELFRDMVTMMLVDGEIQDKERRLILRLAERLGIGEAELDEHIKACREALSEGKRDTTRISARIFRRMARASGRFDADRLGSSYEEAAEEERHEMQVSVLESLAGNLSPLAADPEVAARFGRVVAEDREVARRLVAAGLLKDAELKPFVDEQQHLFRDAGRITSFLTRMVQEGMIDPNEVMGLRDVIRSVLPVEGGEPVERAHENGTLTVRWYRDTLDHTFYVTVMELAGQADHHTVPLLRKCFDEVTSRKGSDGKLLILDLAGAEYLSSAAIGAIIEVRARVLERWGDLRFVQLSPEAEEVIHLLGVDTMIVSCQSRSAALWSFADFAEVAE